MIFHVARHECVRACFECVFNVVRSRAADNSNFFDRFFRVRVSDAVRRQRVFHFNRIIVYVRCPRKCSHSAYRKSLSVIQYFNIAFDADKPYKQVVDAAVCAVKICVSANRAKPVFHQSVNGIFRVNVFQRSENNGVMGNYHLRAYRFCFVYDFGRDVKADKNKVYIGIFVADKKSGIIV